MDPFAYARKNLRHNYIVNILDGGFFGFALGFASFSTVLPLFVSNLTNSAILIGLVPALHNVGWQLPQLLTAKKLTRIREVKPFTLLMTINERIPFLFLAVISWSLPLLGKETALILIFICLAWQGIGGGLTANPWQILISRIIPPEYRATFFGIQSGAANLMASGGAIVAGFLLDRFSGSSTGFTICFLCAAFFFIFSFLFLKMAREEPRTDESLGYSDSISIWKSIKSILSSDIHFLWFIVGRAVFQFGTMASAFYTVYAVKELGMSEVTAGIMTSILMITQVTSNALGGWLADKTSCRLVMAIGSVAAAAAALTARTAPGLGWFTLVFILSGIANSIFWTIGMAMTLEFGEESSRPTYVGLANTLIAPSAILSPLIGGWLADASGYPSTFLVSAVFAGITAFLFLTIVKTSKPASRNAESAPI